MTGDLYEELGVPRDAGVAEVTRAYRRKAMATHPDRPGGDAARFQAVKRAYEVLTDQMRRARYDRTGEADEVLDPMREVRAHVRDLFLIAIEQAPSDAALAQTDLVALVRRRLLEEEATDRQALRALEASVARRELVLRRLRRTKADGKVDLVAAAIQQDIADRRRRIAQGQEQVARHQLTHAVLAEYAYAADPAVPGALGLLASLRQGPA